MVYVKPTAADFKARFPEFGTVPDSIVTAVIDDEADPQIGSTWLERDRRIVVMYLTAHILATQGYPKEAGSGTPGSPGTLKRRKVGDVETEFFGQPVNGGNDSASLAWWRSTPYGQQYLIYRRRNFSAIAVV